MAADTFETAWRTVLMHCPLAGPFLAQQWVKDSYRRACASNTWSWLKTESAFLVSASRTGTVNVTWNSLTVAGVTMIFVAADVDRQFRVSGIPYTITAVNVGANTATLDRVYGGNTVLATSGTVLDAYLVCPEDFGHFIAIVDPAQQIRINLYMSSDDLNACDPNRTNSGSPYAVIPQRLGTTTATDGRARYELWPYQTAQNHFPYVYQRLPEALTDSSSFEGPLARRSDILVSGALSQAAQWPGFEERKNLYFNATLALAKEKEFRTELARLEIADQNLYLTWWVETGYSNYPIASRMGDDWAMTHA
ncbi:MAG: hypothetical protein V1790_00865 [Planctomycetota bacterium]